MLLARRLVPIASQTVTSQITQQVPKALNVALAQRRFATEQAQNGQQDNQQQQQKQTEEAPKENNNNNNNNNKNENNSVEQKLQNEIQQLKEKVEEYKKELTYAIADRENQRKIAKADMEKTKAYGIQSFAASLLDVADNLSMALTSIPAAELEKGNAHLKNLYVGVEMTEKELAKVFTAQGIKKFEPLGEKFNPNQQQAVFEVEDPSKTPGVVAHVVKSGYMIKDRVLRPATVGVVKATPSSPQSASN